MCCSNKLKAAIKVPWANHRRGRKGATARATVLTFLSKPCYGSLGRAPSVAQPYGSRQRWERTREARCREARRRRLVVGLELCAGASAGGTGPTTRPPPVCANCETRLNLKMLYARACCLPDETPSHQFYFCFCFFPSNFYNNSKYFPFLYLS